MKTYITYTETDFQINICANNLKEAIKLGRRACKKQSEKFNSVRLKK